ncbi:CBS domain-containing protein [Sphingomonas jatrophae]|uniref:CBS domain-containing protein n=1 Tax=Sphingomonas jatrophae TaxID=1166337 RepID=A0A1I6LSH7_9SPHN|nr:CBS domain-containing protein [Sphingomonas jatrophae]SFS06260.1 CBS domain-containing protein [Sphingomonas jatrophae]
MTIATILAAKGDDVVTVAPDAPVAEAVRLLAERRIGALPVVEAERVAGILSERDILYGLAEHGPALLQHAVRDVMTAPAIGTTRETPILAALGLMTRRRIRHLPVLDGERLVGFVSIGDLVKARIDRAEAEARALRDYIQTA